jgi:hypothetical protein
MTIDHVSCLFILAVCIFVGISRLAYAAKTSSSLVASSEEDVSWQEQSAAGAPQEHLVVCRSVAAVGCSCWTVRRKIGSYSLDNPEVHV